MLQKGNRNMSNKTRKHENVVQFPNLPGDTILSRFQALAKATPADKRPEMFTHFLALENARMIGIIGMDKAEMVEAAKKEAYDFAVCFVHDYMDEDVMHAFDENWLDCLPRVFTSALEYANEHDLNGVDALYNYYFGEETSVYGMDVELIQAFIKLGHITYEAPSRFGGIVDVYAKSNLFVEPEFAMSVDENMWDDGPNQAVAFVIADAMKNGLLTLKPELLKEEY